MTDWERAYWQLYARHVEVWIMLARQVLDNA